MEKITLSKPFKLKDNREITELSLLLDELSVSDFRQIRKLEARFQTTKLWMLKVWPNPRICRLSFSLHPAF